MIVIFLVFLSLSLSLSRLMQSFGQRRPLEDAAARHLLTRLAPIFPSLGLYKPRSALLARLLYYNLAALLS